MKKVFPLLLSVCLPIGLVAQNPTKKDKCRTIEKALYKGIFEKDLKKVADNFYLLKKTKCFSVFTAHGDVTDFSNQYEFNTIEEKAIKLELDSVLDGSKKNLTITIGEKSDREKLASEKSLVKRKPLPLECKDVLEASEQNVCFQKFILKHVSDHVNHPKEAIDITEKHYVSFEINEEGDVENVKVVRGSNKFLKAEAIRVMNLLPKVLPGMEGDKAIRVKFTIPIMFRAK